MKIIIDAHALAHRARFAMKGTDLSVDGVKTEVILNFLRGINLFAYFLQANEFIFAWDSRKYFRKEVYPNYKSGRKDKTPEDREFDEITMPQFQEIRMKVLPEMGFRNNFIQTGMEADDIIAIITQTYQFEFTIISRDQDLYQLLNDRVVMYDPVSKKFISHQTVFQEYGIEAEKWWKVKSLAGCKTDSVEGIKGIGETTAIKYLVEKLSRKSSAYRKIEDGTDITDRNRNLVKLPFEGTECPKLLPDQLSLENFIKVFEKYNFQSFLADIEDWKNNLRLEG